MSLVGGNFTCGIKDVVELSIKVITFVQSVTKTIFLCSKILKWQTRFSKRFNDKVFEIRTIFFMQTRRKI